MRPLFTFIVAACGCCTLSSCSNSPYELGYVHGTAFCNGKPMTGGFVIFSPIPNDPGSPTEKPGKPATGKFDKEGKFVLTTFDEEDGAVAGKHTARVSMPSVDEDDPPNPPCGGKVFESGTTTERIFDIVAGETHEFTLEFSNSRVTTGPWAAP
jgi:hypothetical protein